VRERAARRITGGLFVSQSLGSAGIIASATVAAIVGAEMSGRPALAGVTAAVSQVGAALAALYWSRRSDVLGRAVALPLSLVVGAFGALLAAAGVATASFALVLVGLGLSGSGIAGLQLGRFVAAEVNPKARRARAIAMVVLGGTVGSVLGPALVAPSGELVRAWGFDVTAGPYLGTAFGFMLTALLLFATLRPEPRRIAEAIAAADPDVQDQLPARSRAELLRDPSVRTAIASVVTAHMVMIGLMQMTSLHMHGHHHPLTSISIVFSSHTLGMFAFSVVSGWLTDRWGRRPVLGTGAALLVVACLSAQLSLNVLPIAVSLFLLGLGWNLCYVAGTALLSDTLKPSERGRIQGFNDLLVGGAAAAAALLGGTLMAAVGYGTMGLIAAAIAAPLLVVVARLPKAVRPALP